MRFAAPKPVKKALPCDERFEPSITYRPRERKPVRRSSSSTRAASTGSLSGENLLNSGITTVG